MIISEEFKVAFKVACHADNKVSVQSEVLSEALKALKVVAVSDGLTRFYLIK